MSTQADAGAPTHLGRHTVLLLAVVCGAAVANIYYAQPLLPVVARAFSVGEGEAGLLVTASQIGYAVALAFLVPIGDVLERRRLVSVLLAVTGVLLLGAALLATLARRYDEQAPASLGFRSCWPSCGFAGLGSSRRPMSRCIPGSPS